VSAVVTRFRVARPFSWLGRHIGIGEILRLPPSDAESWLVSGHIVEADAARAACRVNAGSLVATTQNGRMAARRALQ